MASTAIAVKNKDVPSGPDELVRTYHGYVCGLVHKLGIKSQDVEDVTDEIFTRLISRGVIEMYDPAYTVQHQGRDVRVSFRSFLSAQVALYVKGQRDKIARHDTRELLLLDRPVDEAGTPWAEVFGGDAHWDDYSSLSVQEFVDRMRAHLATVPPRSARDTCDLVKLFDELVREILEDGEISYAVIGERFGISGTTVGTWVARLRKELAAADGPPPAAPEPAPLPVLTEVGGIALTGDQICEAARILREAKGIMVAQPLARAGHPLGEAARGWYHDFARAEMREHPEVVVSSGTHEKPAGHVKTAVIARLERLAAPPLVPALALAVAPDDERPLSLEELLESELWHVGLQRPVIERIVHIIADARASGAVA